MQTRVLNADPAGVNEAAAIIQAGNLVAFPTETVYGLGANALDPHAVEGIFRAKQRPADDPLIVHLASVADLSGVAEQTSEALLLADRFWPGPLTLVLPKTAAVPLAVTAGGATVAVRVPAHPLALALLRAVGLPIAAPSANLFSRPSPTRAQHVLEDLDGRIDAVLDGGPTSLGVESTILDLSQNPPRLLRPGGTPLEALRETLGRAIALAEKPPTAGPQPAPGMFETHYAPRTRLELIEGDADQLRQTVVERLSAGQAVGVLAFDEDKPGLPPGVRVARLGAATDPGTVATNLYAALRSLDRLGLDVLLARQLPDVEQGLGRAVADRLRRAATRR